jgi:hypothetical protein
VCDPLLRFVPSSEQVRAYEFKRKMLAVVKNAPISWTHFNNGKQNYRQMRMILITLAGIFMNYCRFIVSAFRPLLNARYAALS